MPPLAGPTPLIGRERELATVLERVAATGAGAGGVVLITGEAGVGKSRLVLEALASAERQGFGILRGSCFETERALPYAPLLDLLRGAIAGQSAEAAARLGPAAPVLLGLLPEFSLASPVAASDPLPDPEQEKQRRSEAFIQFVGGQAGARPLLVVIEDLHWCDEASLEVLLALARRLAARPILLLLTCRSDEPHPALTHFLAELDRARRATEVRLAPLAPGEVEALLRAIFAQARPVRSEFVAALHALTEGNPFFIEEVLKSLLLAGDIFYADGHWDRRPLHELRIPRTVEDAVRRRVERLSEAARDTLTLAAVIGQRVDIALVQALTGHDERALLRHLKELIAAQLVVEESADTFAFRHALTRQAVYAGLLARERRALHRQVAEALEGLPEATTDARLADLARHFHEAGAWEKALDYARRAGERAQAIFAPHAAIEHFTRALAAAQALDLAHPPDLLRARGLAYETTGEFDRARHDLEGALAATRAAGDRAGEWQALLDLGFLWTARDYAPAGDHFRDALVLARDMGEEARIGHSLNRLGNWYLNGGRPADAIRHYEEALAIFSDLGEAFEARRGLAATLDLLGMATMHSGDVTGGVAYYERVVPLLRELDDRRGLVSSLAMLAESAAGLAIPAEITAQGSLAEAYARGEEAVALARAIGWRAGEVYALMGHATTPLVLGDYGQALELFLAGQAIAEEIEHRGWRTAICLSLGGLCFSLLALPAARRYLERALTEAQELGSGWMAGGAATSLAWVEGYQGELALATATLDAAFGSNGPAVSVQERSCWLVRAELALARDDPAAALAIIDQLIASATNRPATTVIPLLWLGRGRALAALGRSDEAEVTLLEVREAVSAGGLRPRLWQIQIALGGVYQAQARQAEAEREFAAARATVEALAASVPEEVIPEIDERPLREQFLRATAALLPQPRPLTPLRAAKEAFGGLTTREREVATLIARGRSNREIAAALVIGERTVQTHIGNIFAKLGCDSRAQVAAWAVEHGLTRRGE